MKENKIKGDNESQQNASHGWGLILSSPSPGLMKNMHKYIHIYTLYSHKHSIFYIYILTKAKYVFFVVFLFFNELHEGGPAHQSLTARSMISIFTPRRQQILDSDWSEHVDLIWMLVTRHYHRFMFSCTQSNFIVSVGTANSLGLVWLRLHVNLKSMSLSEVKL